MGGAEGQFLKDGKALPLHDTHWEVRAELGTLGDPRTIQALHTLLADPDPGVAQQAKMAIARVEGLL